ncbi:MAG: DUF2029 domain-containing protein [Planctomycetes bacterium]|nr:DUF2029 domain-containing protein [Planctomycetota bacterium]
MAAIDPEPGKTRWGPLSRALVPIAALVLFSLAMVPIANYVLRGSTKDYWKWYEAGTAVLEGGDIYRKRADGTLQFMYPPPAAILLAPPSAGGLLCLVAVLAFANSAAWLAAVLLSVRLATGKTLRQRPLLYVLPSLAVVIQVWETYLLGQPNLILLALALGAFLCLERRRYAAAGSLVALGAAVKAFPVLILPYLLWRRHWPAAAGTIAALLVLLFLLPLPFRGWRQNLADLDTWTSSMLLRYDEDTIAQRPGRSYTTRNQSLVAVANRLLRPADADESSERVRHVNIASFSFSEVNLAILVVALGLGLAYVLSMPPRSRRTPAQVPMELAMLVLLVPLASPFAFSYFFVWLLFPFTVALTMIHEASPPSRRLALRIWLGSAIVLFATNLTWIGQALGASLVASLVLFAGFAWNLRRISGN